MEGKPLYRTPGPSKRGGLTPMHVEDVMQRNALAGFRKDPPCGGVPANQRASLGNLKEDKRRPGIDDGDLIASMAKRLSALEKSLKECTAQLSRTQSENEALKSKLRVAEEEIARHAVAAVDGPATAADGPAVQHLCAENSRLRSQERHAWRQVAEMKQFLAEYGMIWVGDQQQQQQQQGEATPGPASSSAAALPPKPAAPSKLDRPSSGGYGGAGSGDAGTPLLAPRAAHAHDAGQDRPSTSGNLAGGEAGSGGGSSSGGGSTKPAATRSCGTSWSASSAAEAEAHNMLAAGKDACAGEHGSSGYGSLSSGGGGGLWAQPPHPRLASRGASCAHASIQTPPGEEDLEELAEAATAGAAAVRQQSRAASGASSSCSSSVGAPSGLLQDRHRAGDEGGAGDAAWRSAGGAAAAASGGGCHAAPSSSGRPGSSSGGPRWGSGQGQAGAGQGSGAGLPFRLADLLARVAELNQLAGDGCGQMVPGRGIPLGSVLQTPEPVRCTIFEDGLQLHRSPARPFSDPVVTMILRDMLDGFFPGPLKKEFPEGIPIKVIDRTRESYKSALGPVNPHAYGLGGNAGISGGGGASNVHSFHDLELGDAPPMNRDKFLAKLPVSVIKNGKVVDIRCGIGGLMKGAGQGGAESGKVALIPSPADALLSTSQRNHLGPVLPPPSREVSAAKVASAKAPHTNGGGGSETVASSGKPEITTLQVKSEDGQQKMIVRLNYDDTIGALHKCINAHRLKQQGASTRVGAYEVRTAYPARAYSDLTETLRSAGLVPNATVFLRALW